MHRNVSCALLLGLAAVAASAPVPSAQSRSTLPIVALATNAIQGPLVTLAEDYTRRTGQEVTLEFDTAPNITRRLAAGLTGVHLLISTPAVVEQAIREGKALADSRAGVGKVGVGIAIRRGARRPDISTVDGLKASLLQADAVVYTQGASGAYIEKLFQSLGIADQIKGKTAQVANGAVLVARVQASLGNEIGMAQASEIKRGEDEGAAIVLVGPLPAAVQLYTAFEAVVMSGSPDAARAFVRAIVTPDARKALAANGWEF